MDGPVVGGIAQDYLNPEEGRRDRFFLAQRSASSEWAEQSQPRKG